MYSLKFGVKNKPFRNTNSFAFLNRAESPTELLKAFLPPLLRGATILLITSLKCTRIKQIR